ncbi:porin [Janthinobacterium agaricidamnosum]|uniref:Gram-negative porin family protein n=1 Tax=Janthinobacterium agaricidamnosum NBRC 102515 = DSM 9628 TaxID=1349767 RepID=W0UZN9_9BURK|nr:porin [Janthinobacterium agaricidamnosum]CDG81091.1 gram-negative porin family protein [Janthinobacterium agaricidamnosum NBRC 102515 = DSM 9628]
MKHAIIGIALLGGLPGLVLAQSNVDVYGSIDAGLRNRTNVNQAGDSQLTMGSNGTFRSNRLGFKGTEDLGGGLKANFLLESGFNTATGALNNTTGTLFQREAHIGLESALGAIDLGRQYTVAYKTIVAFDPFVYRYPSITYVLSSTAGTRHSNDVQYTGRFNDLTLRAEYALGEVAGDSSSGSAKAVGANYVSGPLKLGASYTRSKENVGSTAAPVYMDYDHVAAGGAYTVGAVTLALGYVDEKQATIVARDDRATWRWAGLTYRTSERFSVTGAWYGNKVHNRKAGATVAAGDGKKDLYMLGLRYDLSKRTVLYAEIDRNKFDGAFASGGTTPLNQRGQTGTSAGIMHMF